MRLPKPAILLASAIAIAAGVRIVSRLRSNRRMDDEVTFVTGGSRGLGLAIAMECARRGSRIAIAARYEDELERACLQLREMGTAVLPIVCDVRDRDQMQRAVRRVVAGFGRIDTLINNAGVIAVGPMETMDESDYRAAMETHFWAPYHAVEAVRAFFELQRAGRIVNIASIGGLMSVPHLLPYSASKFALVGYSEGLAAELARKGISVTTVCPGLMRTGSPRNATFKAQNEKEYAWFMLSDSLPGFSIGARAAARTVVDAALAGRRHVTLSAPAQAAALVHGIAPGFVVRVLSVAARLLPGPGGIGSANARGSQSETGVTRSPLTALGRKAERDFNQLP